MHWIEEKNIGHVTGKYTQIYAFYLKSFSIWRIASYEVLHQDRTLKIIYTTSIQFKIEVHEIDPKICWVLCQYHHDNDIKWY